MAELMKLPRNTICSNNEKFNTFEKSINTHPHIDGVLNETLLEASETFFESGKLLITPCTRDWLRYIEDAVQDISVSTIP